LNSPVARVLVLANSVDEAAGAAESLELWSHTLDVLSGKPAPVQKN